MKHRTIRTLLGITALPLMALLVLNSCSSSSSPVHVSTPLPTPGTQITGDTLMGNLKGYLTSGKTYYMTGDVTINNNDTLYIQAGTTIIVIPQTNAYPEFILTGGGTLISDGTSTLPIYMTVPPSYRTLANLQLGLWGGIQCDVNSGDLILKWTHIAYFGGAGTAVGAGKKVAYGTYFQNASANFIMEDCVYTGGTDDPVRTSAGNVSIFRNVFEAGSTTSGDGFNMKSGTVGDVAYNVFIGNCTNGPKEADKGGAQCNANIYNNTIVCDGWRYVGTGRAGSIDVEDGAEGTVFNNMFINCRTGFRLVSSPLADTLHTYYGYNWYYGLTDSVVDWFYPGYPGFVNDGVSCEWPHPGDVHGAAGSNDPKFVGYDVTAVTASHYTFPIAFSAMDPRELVMTTTDAIGQNPTLNGTPGARFSDLATFGGATPFSSNFRLSAGSPAIGKAYTASGTQAALPTGVKIPMNAITSIKGQVVGGKTNLFGADTPNGLGADFGAYQSNGSGNQQ